MKLRLTILASTVNSRVLRSGDDKGQTKYSVDIYAHSGDSVPSRFVIFDRSSESEARALAAKFPTGTTVEVNLVPRDALYIEPADINAVKA